MALTGKGFCMNSCERREWDVEVGLDPRKGSEDGDKGFVQNCDPLRIA